MIKKLSLSRGTTDKRSLFGTLNNINPNGKYLVDQLDIIVIQVESGNQTDEGLVYKTAGLFLEPTSEFLRPQVITKHYSDDKVRPNFYTIIEQTGELEPYNPIQINAIDPISGVHTLDEFLLQPYENSMGEYGNSEWNMIPETLEIVHLNGEELPTIVFVDNNILVGKKTKGVLLPAENGKYQMFSYDLEM